MADPIVHIATALLCEARPLIERYRLKRRLDITAYQYYTGDGMALIVSGIGKVAMAGAVAYAQALNQSPNPVIWLNIGIAGHPHLPVGQPRIIHKIVDESGRSWYPPLASKLPFPTETLVTVSTPQHHYPANLLYDMEASAFYETAVKFVTGELVQCFKVVSDNLENPAGKLKKQQVSEWIAAQLAPLEAWLEKLRALAAELTESPLILLDEINQRWHLTAQERHQISQWLRRWQLLAPDQMPGPRDLPAVNSSRQLLCWLQQQVEALPVRLA
ncbi:MAG: hypothetical protein AXA67_03190 [Methylothermaceae bacteria B42]|nr:MAG: hypothetical protein AXA67_03190 [Methylothermaceae bacteria B42]HHJ38711.1 hypothetical protein [Methylothermaceae bacterium]